MANHKSAKKRIRRNAHRAEINKSRISRVRTFIKKVEKAIAIGDGANAKEALRVAQPEIMRGVTKAFCTKYSLAQMSRLAQRIRLLSVITTEVWPSVSVSHQPDQALLSGRAFCLAFQNLRAGAWLISAKGDSACGIPLKKNMV